MELKDLQEFIKDEKNAGSFKEMVKALGFETPDDIKELKTKNNEVILRNKKLQEDYVTLKKSVDEVDMEEYSELKKQKESSGSKGTDEVQKLKRDLQKVTDLLNNKSKSEEKVNQELNETLIKTEIINNLGLHNFDNKYYETILPYFLGKARVEVDNGKRSVVIDNGDGSGLSPKEYFQKYSETDTGKSYLRQPDNRGAGSQSFNGGGGSKTMSRDSWEKMSPESRSSAVKSGITITD